MTYWLELLQQVPPWLLPIAITVFVLVLLFILGRGIFRAWPTIKQFVLAVNAIAGLPDFMDRTDESIRDLKKQIENDHKTNMRDDITDAQETAKRVEEGVLGLHEKHGATDDRLASIEAQLVELHDADAELRSEIDDTRPKPQHPTQGEPQ